MTFNYKQAGVDIDAGDALVDWLQKSPIGVQHHRNRIVSGIGGFASLFRIQFPEMKAPCLVTSTDGVGTKVKLASYFKKYNTIGQDLVAMCVNDLLCVGAQPLLFLDYYATGKLHLNEVQEFLMGLRRACDESLCSLLGGETAEMPGVYSEGDFDCAGFAVGIVDEGKTLGAHRVQIGDVVLGISSSGFHSNGYSLLRKVFARDLDDWQEILLRPTSLYAQLIKQLLSSIEIHAAANITGSGIENVPRVLPPDSAWQIEKWPMPDIFQEVQRRTQMSDAEMLRTLNCGVGFTLVLPQSEVAQATRLIQEQQFAVFEIGKIISASGDAKVVGV